MRREECSSALNRAAPCKRFARKHPFSSYHFFPPFALFDLACTHLKGKMQGLVAGGGGSRVKGVAGRRISNLYMCCTEEPDHMQILLQRRGCERAVSC